MSRKTTKVALVNGRRMRVTRLDSCGRIVYGDDNVSGTLATGITVNANSQELPAKEIVVDMIMRGGVLQRIVIPNGQVTEVADIVYVDNELAGFEVTVSAYPDNSGNTHYTYIEEAGSY